MNTGPVRKNIAQQPQNNPQSSFLGRIGSDLYGIGKFGVGLTVGAVKGVGSVTKCVATRALGFNNFGNIGTLITRDQFDAKFNPTTNEYIIKPNNRSKVLEGRSVSGELTRIALKLGVLRATYKYALGPMVVEPMVVAYNKIGVVGMGKVAAPVAWGYLKQGTIWSANNVAVPALKYTANAILNNPLTAVAGVASVATLYQGKKHIDAIGRGTFSEGVKNGVTGLALCIAGLGFGYAAIFSGTAKA